MLLQGDYEWGQRDDFIDAMKRNGRMYPDADYGARFNAWLNSDNRSLIIALGMVHLCVFLHVLGQWTVVLCENRNVAII